MAGNGTETWDLWFPGAAATGLSFARSEINPASALLVHSAPPALNVSIRDGGGRLLAEGKDLKANADTPIARLTRDGDRIVREDIWPEEADIGCMVILPGGEAGKLLQWWNAEDRSEWRWQVEFYNQKPSQ